LAAALAVGCAGGTPPPEEPDESAWTDESDAVEPASPADDAEPATSEEERQVTVAEPEFREGMSVNDAINAIPQGVARVNIDPDVLGEPLRDPELYAPCKMKAHEHVQLRVAVWDGRAVGIDVDSKPKNKKLEECVRQQVSQIKWRDKAKALNTVEYAL
jgi:hypothetical protein